MHLSQADITQQDQKRYSITGVVDFSTVPSLMSKVVAIYKIGKQSSFMELDIDLSQVTACNSAGLALILEMAKDARANNITLQLEKIPESLLSIARAYGIESEIREFCK